MLKKVILSVLLLTVIGAIGAAIAYQAAQPDPVDAAVLPEPLAGEDSASISPDAGVQTEQATEGEPWQASGTIAALDDYGFDLVLEDGGTVYVELGPPDFWQGQGVVLAAGQQVAVNGFNNAGMIHAAQVQLADRQVLQVRTETGQPLWSGGVEAVRGQADGTHTPDPQAQVDEWVTVRGTLMSFAGGSMTIGTDTGELLAFQTGQPRFFAGQGITFQVGEELEVVGFYEGDQFMAGEITLLATNQTVFLRDPNGRPLWAGPGNGNGNGGQTGGRSQG